MMVFEPPTLVDVIAVGGAAIIASLAIRAFGPAPLSSTSASLPDIPLLAARSSTRGKQSKGANGSAQPISLPTLKKKRGRKLSKQQVRPKGKPIVTTTDGNDKEGIESIDPYISPNLALEVRDEEEGRQWKTVPVRQLSGSRKSNSSPPLPKEPSAVETVNISPTLVSGIIGRGGENICKLQLNLGVRISCDKANPGTLSISGPASRMNDAIVAVKKAAADVQENKRKAAEEARTARQLAARKEREEARARREAEMINMKVSVKSILVPGLIGKGGECIKQMRLDSNASIRVSKGNEDQEFSEVVIRGKPQAVQMAFTEIENKAKELEQSMTSRKRGRRPQEGQRSQRKGQRKKSPREQRQDGSLDSGRKTLSPSRQSVTTLSWADEAQPNPE